MKKVRLQKLLAELGFGSRRKCEEMIYEGRVKVNDKEVQDLPVFVDPQKDKIEVDGEPINIKKKKEKIYLLMNKPKKILCTTRDERGRKTIMDLLPEELKTKRLYPVGRLDKDSQGLLILTNDGELTKIMTHPRYGVERVYRAEVEGKITGEHIEKLLKGIWLAEGKVRAKRAKIVKRGNKRSIIEVVLTEGKNRELRRMLARLKLPVKKLIRIKFGPIELKNVGIGKVRLLTKYEISQLKKLIKQKTYLSPKD